MAIDTHLRLFALLLGVVLCCHDKCRCSDEKVHCNDVAQSDVEALINILTSRNVRELHINESPLLHTIDSLCCIKTLEVLDLSNNALNTVRIDSLPALRELNLAKNNLTRLSSATFTSLTVLERLDLSDARLQLLDFDALQHLRQLRVLNMSGNAFNYIHRRVFSSCESLELLDISRNRLTSLFTTYTVPQLRVLNASHNSLNTIESQALSLQELDISHNRFDTIPMDRLRAQPALRILHINNNPITNLNLRHWSTIVEIHANYSHELHVVAAGAIENMPHLQLLDLSHSSQLRFISPDAFRDTPALHTVDVRNCRLQYVDANRLRQEVNDISVLLNGNKELDCTCLRERLSDNGALLDLDEACASIRHRSRCVDRLVVQPSIATVATVGQSLQLYCLSILGDTTTTWQLNDIGDAGRVSVQGGTLHFDFVRLNDAGTYRCSGVSGVDDQTVTLAVVEPHIELFVDAVGSDYVELHWNDSLSVTSSSVRLYLVYRQQRSNGVFTVPRMIPLRLDAPTITGVKHRYAVTKLRDNANYTFCLEYIYGFNSSLYSTCVEATTDVEVIVPHAVNVTMLTFIGIIFASCAFICLARCLHRHFYIWQEEKYRSRMAMSISGQSFLSNADSLHRSSRMAYENIPMSSSLYSSRAASTSARSSHRHLAHADLQV